MNRGIGRWLRARSFRRMLMLAALSMIIAACGVPGTATPDKVAIGAVVPLTGPLCRWRRADQERLRAGGRGYQQRRRRDA